MLLMRLLAFTVALTVPTVCRGEIRRALAIGISGYKNYPADNQLNYADLDAIGFSDLVESAGLGNFKVRRLLNDKATRTTIINAVDDLRNDATLPDTIFVLFSGHAELDPNTRRYYLMPYDGEPNHLAATGIPVTLLLENLEAVGARRLVIFLDACFSGSALGKGSEAHAKILEGVDETLTRLNQGKDGLVMLFAGAGGNEKAWEDDEFHQGIFTHFLIKGLEGLADGIDTGRDGKVTAGELKAFLAQEVRRRSLALGRPAQEVFVSAVGFESTLVLSYPTVATSDRVSQSDETISSSIGRLRSSDPELALMVHVGAIQSGMKPFGPNPAIMEGALRDTLDGARIRKVASLKGSIKADELIGPTFSSDGSLAVACAEDPPRLQLIHPNSGEVALLSPLTLSSANGRRRTALDACNISISRDNRYVAVQTKWTDGTSVLSLIALDSGYKSPFPVADYDQGVFAENFLVLSKGNVLTFVSTDSWSEFASTQLSKPILGLLHDPSSGFVAISGQDRFDFYYPDWSSRSIKTTGLVSQGSRFENCSATKELVLCAAGSGFWIASRLDGQPYTGDVSCASSSCRFFSSASSSLETGGWSLMYQRVMEPSVLWFLDVRSRLSQQIHVPEPVLTGRLLSDGGVIVLGQRGDVFRFSSLRYFDCCNVELSSNPRIVRIAGGNRQMVAVLTGSDGNGQLEVYGGTDVSARVSISDAGAVHQMIWADSRSIIALAGEKRVRLVNLADKSDTPTVLSIDCGLPVAFNPEATGISCVEPDTGNVQVRSTLNGTVQREFTGRTGPTQDIMFTASALVAAGTYSGRNQTLLTMWDTSDGKLISQRTCTFHGTQGSKPIALLRAPTGTSVIELDTPTTLVGGNALTCEPHHATDVGLGSARIASAATAGRAVLWGKEPRLAFVFDVSIPAITYGVRSDLPIDDLSISPDGSRVALLAGGRIVQVPITFGSLLEVARKTISREFSQLECEEFFPSVNCPKLRD